MIVAVFHPPPYLSIGSLETYLEGPIYLSIYWCQSVTREVANKVHFARLS